ncbi:hypothetical protein [Woodsholea maritima]|uniref:hypothetical protein n=1 Tax=Woodsholea maritima TaxID=240237 RepID=UPI000370C1F6|nr:hypothetical protein [Woodsholea maritima]
MRHSYPTRLGWLGLILMALIKSCLASLIPAVMIVWMLGWQGLWGWALIVILGIGFFAFFLRDQYWLYRRHQWD